MYFKYNLFYELAPTFVIMQHKGEIVEKAVRQSGIPLTKLVKRLGKSRKWIYNAFENPQLFLDVILEIGKIIHYDSSNEIKELKMSIITLKLREFSRKINFELVLRKWLQKNLLHIINTNFTSFATRRPDWC